MKETNEISGEIDYTQKISNFNNLVGNKNDDIAIEFLTLANWDETHASKLYLNNVSLPNNSSSEFNNTKFNYLAECKMNLDFGFVNKAFSFIKSRLNITKDNEDYCNIFEGKIHGLIKDSKVFMDLLKINKGIIILYNLVTRQKLLNQLNEINNDPQNNYLKKVIFFPIIDISQEGTDIIKQLSINRFPCYIFCKYKSEKIFYVIDKIEGIFYLSTFKNIICPNQNISFNSNINLNRNYNINNQAYSQNYPKNYKSSIKLNNNINLPNQISNIKTDNKKEMKNNFNNQINKSNNINHNNIINKENKIINNNEKQILSNEFSILNNNNVSFPNNVNNNFSLLDKEDNMLSAPIIDNKINERKENQNQNINIESNNNNPYRNNISNIQNKQIENSNKNKMINNNINNNIFNNISNNKENIIKKDYLNHNENSNNKNNINNNSNNKNNSININNNSNNKNDNIKNNNNNLNNNIPSYLNNNNNSSNKKDLPQKTQKKEYIPDYRDYDFGDELAYSPELDQLYKIPNVMDNINKNIDYNNMYNSQNRVKPLSDAEIRKTQDLEMKELERIEEERLKKEREEKERIKREEEKEKQKIEKEKEEKELFSMLIPPEPEENNPDTCTIIFRLPDGEKNIQRKFLKTEKVSVLYDFIKSLGKEIYTEEEENNFSIIQTFPFKNFEDKINNTLEEEGLFPNSMLQIKENN